MMLRFAALAVAAVVAAGCGSKPTATNQAPPPPASLSADLFDGQGRVVAHVRMTARGTDSVALAIDANDAMPAGVHGVHIHSVGKCEPVGFGSAGPHLNPAAKKHGLQNPDGPHAGDMPNLEGTHATLVAAATMSQVADSDGSAVVLHATKDDQTTDPTGNSGARIACGVISAPMTPTKP